MLLKLILKYQDLMRTEEGQDLVEYALVIALIALTAVASLGTLANKIIATFGSISSDL